MAGNCDSSIQYFLDLTTDIVEESKYLQSTKLALDSAFLITMSRY
ncbi:unnamed protein product [Musa acuminata subsp. malaccensis]|uniref:(wild Malaysian banana) hypothetical protein n=1 Tax=Musa acuminata subsp. malaccensis TaxID=214687 RepID=A0A804IYR2_MUSAM|nr:unnamed protein product [Musa acuminata subsp. malaccensis]